MANSTKRIAEEKFEEDCLAEYLKEISDHHVLTREEEVALFQRYESGDDSAREDLVRFNLRLVVKIALQFRNMGLPVSDLIQEGNIGLMNVIGKFDWRKGFRFSTYAAFWIRQEIQAALRNSGSMIRLPVRKARLLGKMSEAVRFYNNMEGRDPSTEEIAAYVGVEKEKVEMLLPLRESVVSLDADWAEEGSTLLDTVAHEGPQPHARLCEEELATTVRGALDAYLTDRERRIMELRYGLNGTRAMSLRKASKIVGLSQEGVRRIERRALDKLRRPSISCQLEALLTA